MSDEIPVPIEAIPVVEAVKPKAEGRGEYRPENRGQGRFAGKPGRRTRRNEPEFDAAGNELSEKVVFINRSSKVVKGGRRFSFSALVVTGDKLGKVGIGLGKSGEVADAIRKGGEAARANMVRVSLKGTTLPHEAFGVHCGAKVMLRPASPGTGIIAGKTARAVLESVGIKDVLSKSLGSNNAANVVKATLNALRQLRLKEEIYKLRGLAFEKKSPMPAVPAPSATDASTATVTA